MKETEIPVGVKDCLQGVKYQRPDRLVVGDVFDRLAVRPDSLVRVFFENYEGPFWSEHLGYELLDAIQGNETLETATAICRINFGFPAKIVTLTQISAGQVVGVDIDRDEVFEVDFEGGVDLLLAGALRPRWRSFRDFLLEYFVGTT